MNRVPFQAKINIWNKDKKSLEQSLSCENMRPEQVVDKIRTCLPTDNSGHYTVHVRMAPDIAIEDRIVFFYYSLKNGIDCQSTFP
ncbi:MAG TPA: hypothetical protein VF286_08285 [Acidiphilium sp.]